MAQGLLGTGILLINWLLDQICWVLDRAAALEFWRHNNRWSRFMCRTCARQL